MIKTIAKWLMPSSEKLAKYAADGIQKAVNDSSYQEKIAKYSDLAGNATQMANWLTLLLKDGKIDDVEKSEIVEKLTPLFESLMKVI